MVPPTGSKGAPFRDYLFRILNMNHKKELPWSLWVEGVCFGLFFFFGGGGGLSRYVKLGFRVNV